MAPSGMQDRKKKKNKFNDDDAANNNTVCCRTGHNIAFPGDVAWLPLPCNSIKNVLAVRKCQPNIDI